MSTRYVSEREREKREKEERVPQISDTNPPKKKPL